MSSDVLDRGGAVTSAVDPRRGLVAVPGLRGAAVDTGVKPSGDLDLAVVVADEPMVAAAVFTTNSMAAAPVHLGRARLREHPVVRAIAVNAGNANALTGERGDHDARLMLDTLEDACGGPGLVMSTGVIGVPLPVERVCAGIRRAASGLRPDFEPDVPRAMRTTDTRNKQACLEVATAQRTFRIGGVAKGSGMIHPNMATMLAIIATDAPVGPEALHDGLVAATHESFHQITVDGDCSTNDTVVVLARSPGDGTDPLEPMAEAAVHRGLAAVCTALAEQIVADGEGATRVLEVVVAGARSARSAERIASAIACSSLVKTALAGGDPNWGRILAAAGAAGEGVNPADSTLEIAGHLVYRHGHVPDVDEQVLAEAFSAERVRVLLDVGVGHASGRRLSSDLSHEYVSINSEYTT